MSSNKLIETILFPGVQIDLKLVRYAQSLVVRTERLSCNTANKKEEDKKKSQSCRTGPG